MDLNYYRETRSLLRKQLNSLDQQFKLDIMNNSKFKLGDKVICEYKYTNFSNLTEKSSYLKCVVLNIILKHEVDSVLQAPYLLYMVVPIDPSHITSDNSIKIIEVTEDHLKKGWDTDECR